jgi:hypothetical protein
MGLKMYKWLLVLKNGKEYLIYHPESKLNDVMKDILPKPSENKWTLFDLVEPKDNYKAIAINGADISSIGCM